MVRLVVFGALLLFAACGGSTEQTRGPSEPAKVADGAPLESNGDKMARLVAFVADRLEADIVAWAARDFATKAEALQALDELTPRGKRIYGHLEDARAAVGVTYEQYEAYLKPRPTVRREMALAWKKRFEQTLARFEHRVAELDKLPPGELAAVARSISGSLGDWMRVSSLAELKAAVAMAVKEHRALIIHVRANWAVPTKVLEEDVFSDPRVVKALSSMVRIYVDVTERDAGAAEIQKSLGATTLPAVFVVRDPKAVQDALSGTGSMPKPTITTLVDADGFLGKLP